MSDTPKTDAFREVIFAQYKEDELTGDGMGNILAALTNIETLERKRECECKCDVDWPEEYYELRQRLERERDEAREESAKWHQMSIEADTRFVEVMRERDQYKGLLIRLYNDLFVHHKGEAVRDFKALFREENYN